MKYHAALPVVVSLLTLAVISPARAEVDAPQVTRALERGINYLKREQNARGHWTENPGMDGGVTALCTLALLNAGVPPDDPVVAKALAALRRTAPKMTYAVSLQTMVFCAAKSKQDLVLIRKNVKWLEETQHKKGDRSGTWSYPGGQGDNSNTQFALLALHEAERSGIKVEKVIWQRSYNYFKSTQRPEGSWGYLPGAPGTGSMTSAGISGIIITAERLSTGDAHVEGEQVQCCGRQGSSEASEIVENAMQWLGRNFRIDNNPGHESGTWLYYYLYGVERVGRMTSRRFIGEGNRAHDWYREGAEFLIEKQDQLSGYWKGEGHAETNPHIATPLALLFLSKGRRPVVVGKLKHGTDGDWNLHSSDINNLTIYTEQQWHRDLAWQVLDPKAAQVEDLLQAPVLYLTGRNAPEFTSEQKKRLRDYIDRGGFLFAVEGCDGAEFDRGFRALMAEIFPEPEYQLRPLDPSHPIWHAQERLDPKYLRPLLGIEYGCRTSVVYCPADPGLPGRPALKDLSCYWELGSPRLDVSFSESIQQSIESAMVIGVNVLTYATGREPKYKDAIPVAIDSDARNTNDERGTLYVAKLLHGGGCNAAPGALINLLRSISRELKMRVSTTDRQLAITDKRLFHHHLVFMHGRHQFRLTPAERKQLHQYLERGGTIFADSICASPEFAASFRREMQAIWPEAKLVRIPASDEIFTDAFGGFDIRTVMRREPLTGEAGDPLKANLVRTKPDLEAITINGRYAVIFSPYDLSCALENHESLECNGYSHDDAKRIGTNVLLYSLHR